MQPLRKRHREQKSKGKAQDRMHIDGDLMKELYDRIDKLIAKGFFDDNEYQEYECLIIEEGRKCRKAK